MSNSNERTQIVKKHTMYAEVKTLRPDLVESGEVLVATIVENCQFSVSVLTLLPGAKIKEHGHGRDEEEYYYETGKKRLTHCKVGETHSLANDTDEIEIVISVKYQNCSAEDSNKDLEDFYAKPSRMDKSKCYGKIGYVDLYKDANTDICMYIMNSRTAIKECKHEGEGSYEEYILQLPEKMPKYYKDVTKLIRNKGSGLQFMISAKVH